MQKFAALIISEFKYLNKCNSKALNILFQVKYEFSLLKTNLLE